MSKLAELLRSRGVLPASSANPANPQLENSRISKISSEVRARSDSSANLERRIRAMTARWNYTRDELAEVLTLARKNPDGWLAAVALDERRFGSQAVPLTPTEIQDAMRRISVQ